MSNISLSGVRSLLLVMLVSLLITSPGTSPRALAAGQAVDVLFIFDTTGSMSGALNEAKQQVTATIDSIRENNPDSRFAVAQVRDHGDSPLWELSQAVTTDAEKIRQAILPYSAGGGGDSPEAYGTALRQAASDSIGSRTSAKHLVVLVNDDMPHDDDLNASVPKSMQNRESPYNTGTDSGADDIVGTVDDADWQETLQELRTRGIIFASVLYSGATEYLPYWQWWTGLTGGVTETAGSSIPLGDVLEKVINAGISANEKSVVTFGDSIAAGEGSGDHLGYPNNTKAYNAVLGRTLGWSSYNFAISGSCAATFGKSGSASSTPRQCGTSILEDQIPKAAAMNLKPSLITITVGANDIRFADCLGQVLGVEGSLLKTPGGAPCDASQLASNLRALQSNISLVFARLRDLYGPEVPIAVTGYFLPLPGPVSPKGQSTRLMRALVLAKDALDGYVQSGANEAIRRGVQTLRSLDKRSAEYQNSVFLRSAAIVGGLNGTLATAARPFRAKFVSMNFSDHDISADYDGKSASWVLAPQIRVFLSYYGVGGQTADLNFVPNHRCEVRPSCDTNTYFQQFEGKWAGQTGTAIISFWSNDFPHLTPPGQEEFARRISVVMNAK